VQPVAHPPPGRAHRHSVYYVASPRRRDRLSRGPQSEPWAAATCNASPGADCIAAAQPHSLIPARPAYRVLERGRYRNCSRVPCCSSIVRPAKGSPTTGNCPPPASKQGTVAVQAASRCMRGAQQPALEDALLIPRREGFRATRIPRPHNRRPAHIPRVHYPPPRQAFTGGHFIMPSSYLLRLGPEAGRKPGLPTNGLVLTRLAHTIRARFWRHLRGGGQPHLQHAHLRLSRLQVVKSGGCLRCSIRATDFPA
jgi:hypothetical protein